MVDPAVPKPASMSGDEDFSSEDLAVLAPEAEELIRAMFLSLEAVNDMLRDQLDTGASYWDVACRWLRANDLRNSWLPDPTTCLSTYSERLIDKNGVTFVCAARCLECPSETSTLGLGSAQLSDCVCKEGTINMATTGDTSGSATAQCAPCSEGMSCPLGASLESLKTGKAIVGTSSITEIQQGYFTTKE
eukprot:Skav210759  [mRNA]  locus=scaffold1132:57321:60118:- [translate_table: standard]